MSAQDHSTERVTVPDGLRGTFPEYDASIDATNVEWSQIVATRLGAVDASTADAIKEKLWGYYPLMVRSFEQRQGPIRRQYWQDELRSAAALTDNRVLHVSYTPELIDERVYDLGARCEALAQEARRLLPADDGDIAAGKLFDIVANALAVPSEKRSDPESYAKVEEWLGDAKHFIDLAAERSARLQYFYGMLIGLPVLLVAGVATAATLAFAGAADQSLRSLFACVVTGALGAIVSVLSRMTLGSLKLEYDAGRAVLRLLGGVRPFVGAIFGAAFYLVLRGAILPIDVPEGAAAESAFYAAIAFLAGFSERWAQDMLVAGQGRLAAGTGEAGDTGGSAGAATK